MYLLLQDVVYLIKKDPMRTAMLVASEQVDQWYKERGVKYSFELAETYRAPSAAGQIPTRALVSLSPLYHSSNLKHLVSVAIYYHLNENCSPMYW
jgi:hypothetical protein